MTTTPKSEFVPDEELLAFIDQCAEVVRWRALPGSTEAYPMIEIEVSDPLGLVFSGLGA